MDHFEKDLVEALKDIVKAGNWQCVGDKSNFKSPCTKLYSDDGELVVLVHTEDDKFWAMDSSCPHEGGPLEQGDIEELGNGKLALICPWLYFDFSLETGSSSTVLQNQVYDVRVLDGKVYVNTQCNLSLCPIPATNITHQDNFPGKGFLDQDGAGEMEQWTNNRDGEVSPPAQPSRKANLTVLERGKGGTLHYQLLEQRIVELGSYFGALPVHNGLWQSATDTSHDLLARLAIVHMVHEARGLDVHPQTLSRFAAQGDTSSVKVLEVIYTDEITHVAAGLRWFTYICSEEGRDSLKTFHDLVRLHFKGFLKPPFNTEGRKTAGMTKEWYVPLVRTSNLKKT